ncbi:ORF6N domain-containing protein [Nitrosomonas eutropha]|uniref:ORF6N domain-containing protein n=2 Tax=Nitrosomonas eutropha TaxID=916 RepID=A0ABX5MAD1_9PROT|nr:ORF6N domain-containing protein [Nitrosomonas eutropha]ABI58436.1 hypothetical protein Neut_0148 [Nitrosomonas eutropha C91]PXV84258.1 ORF6N domain-containing protein [Nitrosomonas eutropha]SCX19637.1 ORF6N domain-containing protein [Nitrosomonas eutropha]SEI49956.1 ORF6N domain-containing protein [Nitrosomonas eutropha]
MSSIIKTENIECMIEIIRDQRVILDYDIARIYGVETKRINEAVKNNPDKFPQGYFFELNAEEYANLRSKKTTATFAKVRVPPKAFIEKGLYMLATILKSQDATQATLNIIETFSKLRELSRNVKELANLEDKPKQKTLMQRSGELIAEILDGDLQTRDAETTIELNFAVLKFKHTVKKSGGGKS